MISVKERVIMATTNPNYEIIDNPLKCLIGEILSAVIFVEDYVQLIFNGSILTAYVWPVIHTQGKSFTFESATYKDNLCNLIGKHVTEAIGHNDEMIRIVFESGEAIVISLLDDNLGGGPEFATFKTRDNKYVVWN